MVGEAIQEPIFTPQSLFIALKWCYHMCAELLLSYLDRASWSLSPLGLHSLTIPTSESRDGPREVGVHPAALSLPQCTVTVIQRHSVKARGERCVVESKRKVCLLENRIWLVRWSSCTWLGNLSLAPSLKAFEFTSQEECCSRRLIFPSGGMRQSSTFKRPIYGPKYKKLFLGST